MKPNITFFCEMPVDQLKILFSDSLLIKNLQKLGANISMGLLDFSSERASIVKHLTRSGNPITAWLLLPKSQGYWTSLDTVAETVRFYSDFKYWTAKNKLEWAAIGLDIEPKLDRMKLFGKAWKEEIPDLIKRFFSGRKYQIRENDLRALITQIRGEGYAVETYNFPFVIEERLSDSNIISKILGTPALDADREVLMLYSSFFDKYGDAILWSYAHQAQAIGLGSTGGGVELDGGEPLRSMRWIDLRRDLLIASSFTKHIYIFSLEGCVNSGFLERLIDFNWDETIQLPIQTGRAVSSLRLALRSLLWFLSHPIQVMIPLLTLGIFTRKKK